MKLDNSCRSSAARASVRNLIYGYLLPVLETRQDRFNFGGYFKKRPATIIAGFDQTRC
jgi:hypothetical protein